MRGELINVVLFMKYYFYIQYIFVISLKERGKYPAIYTVPFYGSYMYLSMTSQKNINIATAFSANIEQMCLSPYTTDSTVKLIITE